MNIFLSLFLPFTFAVTSCKAAVYDKNVDSSSPSPSAPHDTKSTDNSDSTDSSNPVDPALDSISPTVISKVESYFSDLSSSNKFSGTVLVQQDSKVVSLKSYGKSIHPNGNANQDDTVYGIGSISKQFAAVAVLQLAEQGKLALSDQITKYLELSNGSGITLRHLLNHTSGIPHIGDVPNYYQNSTSNLSLKSFLLQYPNLKPKFSPGSEYLYSSIGYMMLSRVVEIVSNESFETYATKNLFAKADMNNTFLISRPDQNRTALPYEYDSASVQPKRPAQIENHLIISGAGGIFSTVKDLAKWNEALNAGQLISISSLNEVTTPVKSEYGMGLEIRSIGTHKVTEHKGYINGYTGNNVFVPEAKISFVILGNYFGTDPQVAFKEASKVLLGARSSTNGPNSGTTNNSSGLTKEQVANKATLAVAGLVSSDEIDPRWANISPNVVGKKDFGSGLEWQVNFRNSSNTTLYVFLSLQGEYLTFNFTGQ